MKLLSALLLLAGVLMVGCGEPKVETTGSSSSQADAESGSVVPQGTGNTGTPQSPPKTGGESVQVLTGGAGAAGVTPVVGTESMGGSGSGVNSAAKDSARNAVTKVQGTQPEVPADNGQAADDQVVDQ